MELPESPKSPRLAIEIALGEGLCRPSMGSLISYRLSSSSEMGYHCFASAALQHSGRFQ
jgi:hypothetical protein